MPQINNADVYGLSQSIFRSGYPMRKNEPSSEEFMYETSVIAECIKNKDFSNPHIKRAINLSCAKGAGHDQFLTGIIVQFDLTISNKAWVEAERYHFLDFISSMSTMHRASLFDFKETCNEFTTTESIESAERLRDRYNNIPLENKEEKSKAYLDLLYNIPSGFELMAGMTTNYRCLKNMYRQRRLQAEHRLQDWWAINDWIETLPMAKELICV